ncbi:unnamed protein product [Hyaloperonospora brassicae]|uniref:Peptidase A2 domain-containing protein n=1 Tax=Hyaloperonospora brassicae TaxID=162125 RepID=A0AAV0UUG5_HYABA|nr:unnamed protein product [Hyaloperonospora brassicae]
MTTSRQARASRSLRQAQGVANSTSSSSGKPPHPLESIEMSFLSNATSFVDNKGVGHVKVNNGVDWSNILPKDATVHISYGGSGSKEEILVVPIDRNTSDATSPANKSVPKVAEEVPTGSGSSENIEVVVDTGSDSTVLIVVGSVLGVVAIVAVIAVAVYGRRIRRRAQSDDQSSTDEAFIVGSRQHRPAPPPSALDTDMTPDLWVEGQYQYSPNMSRLQSSLNGTAILSDNKTTPMHDRLTVDAYPTSGRGHHGHSGRGDSGRVGHKKSTRLDQHELGQAAHSASDEHRRAGRGRSDYGRSMRSTDGRQDRSSHYDRSGHYDRSLRRDLGTLEDISDRGRHRAGTTPIVLYDEDSIEDQHHSSRKHRARPPRPHPPPFQQHDVHPQAQQQHQQQQQQQRRRDKDSASRRDR